ncbi:hypothetical protein ACIBEJ_48645 [Nonomuraea sp. NPDC050790]|uniref:hypothetical protein n=1 Tax=Nonomuraea sp. NPDC050790 TaxID=3364371 RepID=UPI0037B2D1BF
MGTYAIDTQGDVALVAATAKTVLNVVAATGSGLKVVELSVTFDGTSVTAEPVTVELTRSTQATAGTSTATTPAQVSGASRAALASGARAYTAEPTVVSVVKRWLVHPQAGLVLQFPLGREPQQNTAGQAMGLRCTAPAGVNCQAYMEWTEDG